MASRADTTDRAPPTPYALLGGFPVLERVVNRFYDLIDSEPAYAKLRALHAPDLAPMRFALASFLAGWSGGPRDWFERNPGKCMASAHSGVTISRETADQWADAMGRAIADCGPESLELGEAMAEMLGRLATGMARG